MDVIDLVRFHINMKAFIVATSGYIHFIVYLILMFTTKVCIRSHVNENGGSASFIPVQKFYSSVFQQ